MSKVNNIYNKDIIKNIIDNAVIGNSDAIPISTFQFLVAL
jgi:hypothetical protein